MELIITGLIAFASTNIDDIFILMLLFADNKYKTKQIVIGQYLGIIALFAISLLGSLIGFLIEPKYIGLLGVLPIYLGIRNILKQLQHRDGDKPGNVLPDKKSNETFAVASITFANGGDNIGIYIPLFATLSMLEKAVVFTIFLLMVAVWCMVAKYVGKHPAIAKVVDKYGRTLTPIMLIALGIYILYESGSLQLIW